LDRPHMDIKPDVHTKRVLYHLGMSEGEDETAAIFSGPGRIRTCDQAIMSRLR
jgi:hypothetical protein